MSAVAVTPGAVAKIRESKIVTDELNVQVRSRSCSLSFFPSLSLCVCVCVCVCWDSYRQGSFQTFSLSGISLKVRVGLKIFSRVFKKKKDSN